MKYFLPEHLERNKAIAMRMLHGYSRQETAEHYGLSPTRISTILMETVALADPQLGAKMFWEQFPLSFARRHFDRLEPKILLLKGK